ncbi:hypothetical protein ID866_8741 [Astraeus odoratus]|nr:hypothetical protein ID866_8741 [Astraeus odoratus]
MNYVCQQCKEPLQSQLDASLVDLSPSQYDMIAASLPPSPSSHVKYLSETDQLSQLPPSSAKAAWQNAKPADSSARQSVRSQGKQPLRSYPAPNESFVLLQDSIVHNIPSSPLPSTGLTKAIPNSSPSNMPTMSGPAAGTVLHPEAEQPTPTPISHHLRSTTRLFNLLSSRTDIDHPLCAECAQILLSSLQRQLDETKKERDGYIAFEREVRKEKERESQDIGRDEIERKIERLRVEEHTILEQLRLAEREKEQLDEELRVLELEEKMLESEEAEFWRLHNEHQLTSANQASLLASLRAAYAADYATYEKLERTNVYNDAFCIGHDGVFGTINGLRLGRVPGVPVEWSEINAAWGQTLLLLYTIARKLDFTFENYRLVPMGSFSRIERTVGDKAAYELYGSGDLHFGRLLHNRRFDFAMVAFLDCLKQSMDYVKSQDPSLEFPHHAQDNTEVDYKWGQWMTEFLDILALFDSHFSAMGLLYLGTPLAWDQAKRYADHVRHHGITQFLHTWDRVKDRTGDELLWGDEVEYMVIAFDHDEKNAKLSLRQTEILAELAEIVESLSGDSPDSVSIPKFHPEYGRYMLESTPGSPYTGSIPDLLSVEANMRYRRALARNHLKEDEIPITLTSFPRLARRMYDALIPIGPIMLALTAASPIWRGYLADVDCRWNVIAGSVDDRTEEERGIAPLKTNKYVVPKSRYDSVDLYISQDWTNKPAYNDAIVPYDEAIYSRLLSHDIDDLLSKHIAHLFIRDPLVVFSETIDQDDASSNDHFENIQSTNWQTLRFKPPPPKSSIGWRVEFRSMEVQMTDFENAAFAVFIVLLSRAILAFSLNFYIPISKVDENMTRAQNRDAAHTGRFFFRKNVLPPGRTSPSPSTTPTEYSSHTECSECGGGVQTKDRKLRNCFPPMEPPSVLDDAPVEEEYEEMTMEEIFCGKGPTFPGLLRLVEAYVESLAATPSERQQINKYLDLVRRRANGTSLPRDFNSSIPIIA